MENYMNEAATLVAANPNLMQIEEFFEQNYLFRNNVLNGRYEVACIGSNPLVWQHLTNERWNSIVWNLEMALPDVKSLKKYAEMYVYSEHTPLYDPIAEYMNKLPAWDGKDHVGNLINCLVDINKKIMRESHFLVKLVSKVQVVEIILTKCSRKQSLTEC